MSESGPFAVAIDTAGDVAGVALFDGAELLAEVTWRSRQNQSRELLPTLEWLLSRSRRDKAEIGAIYVCSGPGSYAGLRVGISTAKALAYGLGARIAAAGRLQADAHPYLPLASGRVFAVHAAGRAELAWAAYTAGGAEVEPPRLGPTEELLAAVNAQDVVTGALASLPADLVDQLRERGVTVVEAAANRVVAVGRIGHARLVAGDLDDAATLVPLYLRAPAIGPQPPRR